MKKVIAIYHKDCTDGTTAAAVVLRKFPDAVLIPLSHGYASEDFEPVLAALEDEADVYTVDCGLGVREVLDKGFSVTTLDHHISTKDELETLAADNEQFTFIFDNDKSGTSLAWSHFFSGESEPEIITYVEDVDLWKRQHGAVSHDVHNYLSIFVNDPASVLEILEGDINVVKEKGHAISQYIDTEIERFIERPPVTLKIGDYIVPAFNITTHQSPTGNLLAEKLDQAAVMFTIKGDKVNFSFRSKEHQEPSALQLAKIIGGGGHVCAAGARMELKDFINALQ